MILAFAGLALPATTIFVLTVGSIVIGRLGGFRLFAVVGLAALTLALTGVWRVAEYVSVGLIVTVIIAVAVHFARLSPAARRHYVKAIWVRCRWRSVCRNVGLSYRDRHIQDKRHKTAALPVTRNLPALRRSEGRHRVRHPRVWFYPDEYGIVGRVTTIPGVGREEFDDHAQHLADAFRCARVQVAQRKAGKLIIRGIVRDPLAEDLLPEQVPAGTYSRSADPGRPYLGLSEWGEHQHLRAPGRTGLLVGGEPGRGKSTLINSLLMGWAGTAAVQFALADGKEGGDQDDWHQRAWLHCGRDLDDVIAMLSQVHALMRARLKSVRAVTGRRNAWDAGPSEGWPLLVTVIDECATFLDVQAVASDRDRKPKILRIIELVGDLIRQGRSAMMFTILATQKPSTDAVPSQLSANLGLRLCFGVKTVEAAITVLGAEIRDHESYSPVGLSHDDCHIGAMTTTIRTGGELFTRVKVPKITQEAAEQRAAQTAHLRRDPAEALAFATELPQVPADISELDEVTS